MLKFPNDKRISALFFFCYNICQEKECKDYEVHTSIKYRAIRVVEARIQHGLKNNYKSVMNNYSMNVFTLSCQLGLVIWNGFKNSDL
jgi:hypothetical protein